jgi:hypothetical protein
MAAKNFATIYAYGGDSVALNQRFFIVEESTSGVFAPPTDTDFFFTRAGGAIDHSQPYESSDHRSGRHNNSIVEQKKETAWTIPTYVNIDTAQGSAGIAEVDPAIRTLWKSTLGTETIPGGVVFTPADDPSITFSLYENMNEYAHQSPAAFVMSTTLTAPGDGTATLDWAGNAADRYRVGIGQTTANNDGGNTVTLVAVDEAKRFPVGSQVMIITDAAGGATRSADTPNGTYRTVTDSDDTTGIVTLSGAVLSDADGSAAGAFYLAFAEPETPTAIEDILTGLVGSMSIDGLGGVQDCVRSTTITMENNHELVNYCYGTASLAHPYFVPGARLNVNVEIEQNMNHETVEWLYDLDQFTAQDIDFVLGDAAGRHLKIDLPKVIFQVPSTETPEEGSIPFTSSGLAFQTAAGADEITVSYL